MVLVVSVLMILINWAVISLLEAMSSGATGTTTIGLGLRMLITGTTWVSTLMVSADSEVTYLVKM